MNFLSQWWRLGVAAVGAVALWALIRPGRQHVRVASLQLWQEAASALTRRERRTRRISGSWLLLLLGAVAAVLALSRPTFFASRPIRHVSIQLCPAAEVATERGMEQFREAASGLLERLDAEDQVTGWTSTRPANESKPCRP